MNHLEVEFLGSASSNASIKEVSYNLDSVNRHLINQIAWPEYNYSPEVHFTIAYGDSSVFLKYYVNEKNIRAANSAVNDPVYEDSCVEFFIGFADERTYYNFEFNCIGTALVGYGESKTGRTLLPAQLISQIKYQSVISNNIDNNGMYWELTVVIPSTLFCFHHLEAFKGLKCRANFYKCGDLLPTPHFITWSKITWPEPNFHLPGFFGSLDFR